MWFLRLNQGPLEECSQPLHIWSPHIFVSLDFSFCPQLKKSLIIQIDTNSHSAKLYEEISLLFSLSMGNCFICLQSHPAVIKISVYKSPINLLYQIKAKTRKDKTTLVLGTRRHQHTSGCLSSLRLPASASECWDSKYAHCNPPSWGLFCKR